MQQKRIRSLLALLALSLASAALADPFDAPPRFVVGDSLTFSKRDPISGQEASHWQLTAQSVTPDGIVFAGVNGERQYTYRVRSDLNPYQNLAPSEVAHQFEWPLVPGKSWSYELAEPNNHHRQVTASVVGEEQVTTPAGTFAAMKLRYSGTWENEGNYGTWEEFDWYAPRAKGFVKRDYVSFTTKHRRSANWTTWLTQLSVTN